MTEPTTPAAGGVFISYRRQDTGPYARLLYEELRRRLDSEQVFMDVDSIEVGVDFAEAIQHAVAACEVLLALVGPQWLTITDANGQQRLEDPDDTVRLEIEAALTRNIRVIPVLVDNTVMPQRQQLPESLAPLSRRNALELSHNRYRYDLGRLLEAVERVLGQRFPPVAATSTPPSVPAPAGLQLDSNDPDALKNRGAAYLDLGRFEEALRDFDQALELDPNDAFALKNRGATYLNLGRFEEALRDLDQALQVDPDDAYALRGRGATYLNLGRNEEARRDLDQALQLDPNDAWALEQRRRLPPRRQPR
jgi:tetratricopeptide (TPR) repeat protein